MTNAYALLHTNIQRWLYDQRWEELRSIQVEAIQAIIADQVSDLIISARTASGKTEAAFLPILSRIADDARGSVRALYVGPLRALINDQFRRMELLCGAIDVPVHRWHGEVGQSARRELIDNPGGVLLITPESIESLFINRTNRLSDLFSRLEFVVIDELHVFPGTERGMHLRSLLARLEGACGRSLRRVGLSATLGEPLRYAAWMRPSSPSTVRLIVQASTGNEFKTKIHAYVPFDSEAKSAQDDKTKDDPNGDSEGDRRRPSLPQEPPEELIYADASGNPNALQMCEDILLHHREGTNLVFANAKRELEETVAYLRYRLNEEGLPEDRVLIHHGSLSKEVREDAERTLQQGGDHTCFCSSTLELGVDIGSVRGVGHLGAPWTVASFAQRLGRSGRRPGEPSVLRQYHVCWDENDDDHVISEQKLAIEMVRGIALTLLFLERWCESPQSGCRHWSTLAHQIMSVLAQTGGTKASQLYSMLGHRDAFDSMSEGDFIAVLRSLGKQGIVHQLGDGTILLDIEGERIANDRDFYAVFMTSDTFRVVHDERTIGELGADQVAMLALPGSEGFRLAGRAWKVIDVDTDRRLILVVPNQNRHVPRFSGRFEPRIDDRLAATMRRVLDSSEPYQFLDAHAARVLHQARQRYAAHNLPTRALTGSRTGHAWLWVGSRILRTIVVALRARGLPCEQGQVSLACDLGLEALANGLKEISDQVPVVVEEYLNEFVTAEEADPKSPLMREKYDYLIPRHLLAQEFIDHALDVPGAERFMKQTFGCQGGDPMRPANNERERSAQ